MYAQNLTDDVVPSPSGDETLDRIYRALSAGRWSAGAAEEFLPVIAEAVQTLCAEDRLPWIIGLREIWMRHRRSLSLASRRHLLTIAAAWSDWPLVSAIADVPAPLSRRDSLLAVQAKWHMADVAGAIERCRALLLAAPHDPEAEELFHRLSAWRAYRDRVALAGHCDHDIVLEPLGHHFIADFAWQYDDPAIADLCSVPIYRNADEWHDWLEETTADDRQLTYAVIHVDWGFIGVVSLALLGSSGHLYYWLGRDFRGNGVGPRAAGLLLCAAEEHLDLHTCYARVYAHNSPSRRGLEKLGFAAVDVELHGTSMPQLMYRRGPEVSRYSLLEEMRDLLSETDTGISLAHPWCDVEI